MLSRRREIEVGIVKVEVADAVPSAPWHTKHCAI